MQIQKNSRQMPKTQKIISEKYYSDILYAYFQGISLRNETTNIRWFPKSMVNFSNLESVIGISRQTISKKFKKLVELGLIAYQEEEDIYILPNLNAADAFLIPFDTLRKMTNTLNENTISTYIYLINRYIANNEQSFDFTLAGIKEFLGLGTKSNSNNYIIIDILEVLSLLGLISYNLTTKRQGQSTEIKTYYHLNNISLTCK